MPLVPDVTGRRQGHPHSWLLTGDHSWRSSGSTLLFLIPQSKLASKWQWSTGTRAELKARASQVPSQLPEGLQSAEAFVMAELTRRGMPPLDVAQPLDVPAATHACVEPMTPGPVAPEPMTPGHGPLTPLSASKAQPRSLLQRAADGAKAFGAKISLSPTVSTEEVLVAAGGGDGGGCEGDGGEGVTPAAPTPRRSPLRRTADRLSAGAEYLSPTLVNLLSSISSSMSKMGRRQEEMVREITAEVGSTKASIERRFNQTDLSLAEMRSEANAFYDLAVDEMDDQAQERDAQGAERKRAAEREALAAEREVQAAQERVRAAEREAKAEADRRQQAKDKRAEYKLRSTSSATRRTS